jgi:Secretion system C-terminal sorting domain
MIAVNITAAATSCAFIKIFDSKGSLIQKKQAELIPGNNKVDIDIKTLASGVYQVAAEWDKGNANKTIALVKQ